MRPPLEPLYTIPDGDHHTLVVRLPCGTALDLVVFSAGFQRSLGVWQLAGRALRVVGAGEA